MPTLSTLPRPWRALLLCFLVLCAFGLGLALAFVHHTAGFTPASLQTRFAGPETVDMPVITAEELLQTTHTHLFTMAFLALLLGGIFLLSSAPSGLKTWVVSGTFASILVDHAGMWLTKAISPAWVWLLAAGGIGLSIGLAIQLGWGLWDLSFGYQPLLKEK